LDSSTILVVALVVLGLMMAVFLFANARRRDAGKALGHASADEVTGDRLPVPVGASPAPQTGRELERTVALERTGRGVPDTTAPPAPPALPPDEESLGVTRRQVLNRGIVATMTMALAGFGAATVAMLWPTLKGGFGDKIRAGKYDEIMSEIADSGQPFYVGAGRFYIQPYPKDAVPAAKKVAAYAAVIKSYDAGVVALYQKCPHLGCRVPWCKTSQWFECPCHGSQYNRVGEKKGGPAPRGMDRFVAEVDGGGNVVVDTKLVIPGPPIGTNTTGQEAEGPHCIGAVGGH
jgi:cytochrome b6-f complex iron-sulfur subunit